MEVKSSCIHSGAVKREPQCWPWSIFSLGETFQLSFSITMMCPVCVPTAAASKCWSEGVCLCQYFQAVAAAARHPSLCAAGRGALPGALADGSQSGCSGDSCRCSPVSTRHCTGRMRASWHRGNCGVLLGTAVNLSASLSCFSSGLRN